MKWLMGIMNKSNKSRRGFTFIELLIVLIIVAVLAAAAWPMYKKSVRKARASEGKALLASVRTEYLVRFSELGVPPNCPVAVAGAPVLDDWDIDSTKNQWWRDEGTTDDFTLAFNWTTGVGSTDPHNTTVVGVTADIVGITLVMDLDTGTIAVSGL